MIVVQGHSISDTTKVAAPDHLPTEVEAMQGSFFISLTAEFMVEACGKDNADLYPYVVDTGQGLPQKIVQTTNHTYSGYLYSS